MVELTPTRLSLVVRVLIALFTRTFFQPDEYFQALEPAYNLVFGYGHLTWEWLAPTPIRSVIYPALNAPIYWVLKVTGASDWGALGDWILIIGPKVMHGCFAAATDIWVCELTRRAIGQQYVSTVLFLSLNSFFHTLSLSRSLSNSLETSLTTIAFAYYPWDTSSNLSPQLIFHKPTIRKTLIFAALACMVRPTNAIIWTYLLANVFWALRSHRRFVNAVFLEVVWIGTITFLAMFILDSLYYSKPTFTPLNFLLTNLSSVSLFYGSSPWHYYVTQGFPILCTTALPFVLHGIWTAVCSQRAVPQRTMIKTVAWTIAVYSLAGHKEWRFIHPTLPLLHVIAAKSLVDLSSTSVKKVGTDAPRKTMGPPSRFNNLPPIRPAFLIFLLLSLPASIYVVLFYCSGPISVQTYIRSIPREDLRGGIGFLTPCHSTPGHAYLHRRELAQGIMWALGCEPPLENQPLSSYLDQTDVFFSSPKDYLHKYFPARVNPAFPRSLFPASVPGKPAQAVDYLWAHEWPRYLVMFGALLEKEGVRALLVDMGYKEVWRAGRTWEGEGQRKGAMRVWKWSKVVD